MIIGESNPGLAFIFLLYGLAFFCMGLAIILEGKRGSDIRLQLALKPLAAFGLIHGVHEWVEMFRYTGYVPATELSNLIWTALRLSILAFSFISLAGFGFSVLSPNLKLRRVSLVAPLILTTIWGFGLIVLGNQYGSESRILSSAFTWTRYTLGIPAALSAAIGLIVQQRTFRKAGMAEFGRDSLIAALAFAWYGLAGQVFVDPSSLPPSTYLNSETFLIWFGFPVQILRAGIAVVIAVFVIRFMRAFDAEIQREIAQLQAQQLEEAKNRDAMRGELLRRVVAAQESERQRIARELHDETGQTLTALGLGLRGITSSLNEHPRQAEINLRKLEDLVTNSLEELQRMISNLRPTHLDDLGLTAALRWYCSEIESHSSIKIKFDVIGVVRPLSDNVKTTFFRIVQEAINNVLKHANATQIWSELRFGKHKVEIMIEDNGIGMDLEQLAFEKRPSWGLLGMQERAALLGGEFNLISKPREGTCIQVSIPYSSDKNGIKDIEELNQLDEIEELGDLKKDHVYSPIDC